MQVIEDDEIEVSSEHSTEPSYLRDLNCSIDFVLSPLSLLVPRGGFSVYPLSHATLAYFSVGRGCCVER